MADYSLTEETRKHRLEEFNRMLPLLRKTLKYRKQMLKEKQKLKTYDEYKKELERAIETANNLVDNELFCSSETQVEIIQEKIKQLEDDWKKTKEFISVFESSVDELENKVYYYENFIYKTLEALADNEPILNEKEVDSKDIKEYAYLIVILEHDIFNSWFHRKSLLTPRSLDYFKEIILNDEEFSAEDTEAIIRFLKLI